MSYAEAATLHLYEMSRDGPYHVVVLMTSCMLRTAKGITAAAQSPTEVTMEITY